MAENARVNLGRFAQSGQSVSATVAGAPRAPQAGSRIRALLVDDIPLEAEATRQALQPSSWFDVINLGSVDRLLPIVAEGSVDVVLCELAPWGLAEFEILDRMQAVRTGIPVVIVTSRGCERSAVEAMKRGAADYFPKSAQSLEILADELTTVVERARGVRVLSPTATSHHPTSADHSYDPQLKQLFDEHAELNQAALLEPSLGLLCVVGFDGFMKRWNPSWISVFGYTYEEMMSKRLRELMHPDDAARVAAVTKQLHEGTGVAAVESRILCKDGSYKWILWNAVPCPERQVFFATGQDITGRKQIEERLRESQARFQLIASATNEAVWDWDLRENRVWRNDAYRQNYGDPDLARESPVHWWRQRVHPADRERILAAVPPPVVNGHQQWTLEYRLRRADDTYATVYDRGFVVFDSRGEPVRMVGSLMDISELKATEEKLRESEERFRLAAKATRDAIWDWDFSKGEVWRSEGFQTLFGYRAEEITPTYDWWFERIHPDDRENVMSEVAGLNGKVDQQCALEYRFRRADGTYTEVSDRGFVMHAADGTPARMIGIVMDVSERRRAEEVSHLQQAQLAHMSRVSTMGEIATGVAHELNQPLTAISNYAESCARAIASGAPDKQEKVLAWIEKIVVNTDRAAQMIRRLRGFTRKTEPRRSTVDVNELVQEVIELMEAETRLQNVRVRWRPGPSSLAAVDRVQVQQVLVNLLRNAYEAMSALPLKRRQASIAVVARDNKVEISVEDAGEGIPPDSMPHVFEAFFTSKPNGLGIGLAISRSIVEDHGGRLWVETNPVQGVTFRFTLPQSGERT